MTIVSVHTLTGPPYPDRVTEGNEQSKDFDKNLQMYSNYTASAWCCFNFAVKCSQPSSKVEMYIRSISTYLNIQWIQYSTEGLNF